MSKIALISVSNKDGIIDFAKNLISLEYKIISTGGTYQLLKENNIDAIEVSEHTGFPEIMDGRIKTLHPKIHAGILSRRKIDKKIIKEHSIDEIDIVVVNLYPFYSTAKDPNSTESEIIDILQIDEFAEYKNHKIHMLRTEKQKEEMLSIMDNFMNAYRSIKVNTTMLVAEIPVLYTHKDGTIFKANVEYRVNWVKGTGTAHIRWLKD